MTNDHEKRLDTRQTVNMRLTFELIARESRRHKDEHFEGICLDISRHGLGLITDRFLEKGEVLKLFFPIPELNTTMPLFGEVVWTMAATENCRAGLRFVA